jgi:hypothetical protein
MAGRSLPASAVSTWKTWRSSRPSSSGCQADEQLADWGELRVTSQPGWLLPCQSTATMKRSCLRSIQATAVS